MKAGSFDSLGSSFDRAGVRYLVAGGLAVNAHGYLRFTRDVDLVLHPGTENILSAFAALARIGYKPLVPITAADFADQAKRAGWIRDKAMTVLNFWSEHHRETPIDVFVTQPFDFDQEYAGTGKAAGFCRCALRVYTNADPDEGVGGPATGPNRHRILAKVI